MIDKEKIKIQTLAMPSASISVFFSYAHEDEALRDQLANHLKTLEREGTISNWHDRRILPGTDWDRQINSNLQISQIILLLISADFLASDYCWDVEVKEAMKRHEAGECQVIPIILRECDWDKAPFGRLQALPKNAAPVTRKSSWDSQDEAFADVVRGIRKAAAEISKELKLQALEQYRDEVSFCLEQNKGQILGHSRRILDRFRNTNGLSAEEAADIETEQITAYEAKEEAISEYEAAFIDALKHESPLSEGTQLQFKRFQEALKLTDAEVYEIEKMVSPPSLTEAIKLPEVVRKELHECEPSKILFIKNIRDPSGAWAYTPEILQHMKGVPESRVFELFWLKTSRGVKLASKGDLMILNQHAKVTHVVEMLDNEVRSNDVGYFRWVRVVWMPEKTDWSQLPHQRDILGFDPPTIGGGATYSCASPNAGKFRASWDSLAAFQQQVFQKLTQG